MHLNYRPQIADHFVDLLMLELHDYFKSVFFGTLRYISTLRFIFS